MIKLFLRFTFCLSLIACANAIAQTAWTWTELDTMPIRISNNAVAEGTVLSEPFVFSFGGIDTSKIYSGITNRTFRYSVNTAIWDEISAMPVSLPLIASSASTVENKIYIIGGYHVYSNGTESSSNEVIIYDPETNSYMPNGTPIPVPIDDQTQCVWRDSLIYVISGWSNTGNVVNVQIYNPELDSWSSGTPVPNLSTYKVFGSSGYILGDTIYYFGGASTGVNFPSQNKLRKGIINSSDPSQITWTLEQDGPNNNYRSASIQHGNNIFWIGGSSVSYNYNGIAYNGSGGVSPLTQIMRYDAYTKTWFQGEGAPYGQMDLRGAAKISPVSWIICGGMETGQVVSNRTFLLTYDPITGSVAEEKEKLFYVFENKIFFNQIPDAISIYSIDGRLLYQMNGDENIIPLHIHGNVIIVAKLNDELFSEKIYLE